MNPVEKMVAAAIAERLYHTDQTREEYLYQCKVAGKKVNGLSLDLVNQEAEAYWDSH